MLDRYKTLKDTSEGLYKEKGSKFFSYAFPVLSREEVNLRLLEIKKKNHDARHHCYAYKLGTDGSDVKANDDNEPMYTAGKPILGQLDAFDVTNVLVVVVRYFGGTLLGKGGLITAYREAACDALKNAVVIDKTIDEYYQIDCSYEELSHINRIFKELHLQPSEKVFEERCVLKVPVRLNSVAILKEKLKDMHRINMEYLYTA